MLCKSIWVTVRGIIKATGNVDTLGNIELIDRQELRVKSFLDFISFACCRSRIDSSLSWADESICAITPCSKRVLAGMVCTQGANPLILDELSEIDILSVK
ncbi:hypothetical protein [Acidithrix sp. C25]|uniref:hypothetical protein n=1 Tax=Acidithrix sp. C25 TaxID=1671482 RepID=UPI00191BA948|nr:hypothetical protein [Acidithrix sp. C25]CAG4907271.1 unnamed protein product [Acidithrix sp. C25]